jgi:hypothetical protein
MRLSSGNDFESDHLALSAELRNRKRSLSWYTESWYPYPVLLSEQEVQQLTQLQELIRDALLAIVPRYLHDQRLQERIPLTPWVRDLFSRLDGSSYEPGALRPDFLILSDGSVQVCEINARFPLNGFFISLYTEEILAKTVPGFQPASCLRRLPEELMTGSVTIVKSQERGYDLFLYSRELEERGFSSQLVDLQGWRETTHAEQVMLELHVHELQQIPIEFLVRFHKEKTYFNDLRTIVLGHDKRLLSILSDQELLSCFLPPDRAHTLARQMVPTYTLGRPPDRTWKRWVLKPAHKGKGEGVKFSDEPILKTDFVLQPEIEQRTFTLHNGTDVRLVGLLPMWRNRFYGPGIFRAGSGPIINLSDGGLLIGTGVES